MSIYRYKNRRVFLFTIFCFIFTFFLSACGKAPESESPVKNIEPLPAYQILKTEKLSYDRLSLSIVVDTKATASQLTNIANEIIEKVKKDIPFHAIVLFFNDYPEYMGFGATLGKVTYGPNGDIAYDSSVRRGDYDKMSFSYELKEKDWSTRLSPEEVKIWFDLHQYFLTQRKNNDIRAEEELIKEFAASHKIDPEKLNSISLKQLRWSM